MEISKLKSKEYHEAIRRLKEIYKRPKYRRPTKDPLPDILLKKHPDLSEKDIKFIRRTIIGRIGMKNRRARILDYIVPHLGQFKTHGGRKKTWVRKVKKEDRIRKRVLQKQKNMTKERLLW